MINGADYGPLADVVTGAGSLMAAGLAIKLSFKGRAKWEPAEEDLPKGAQRVGGLLSAVVIATIWFWLRDPSHVGTVTKIAISLGAFCVFFLLAYVVLIQVFVYEQEYAVTEHQAASRKIIGGFWLSAQAKESKQKNRVTTQKLFKGAAYDPDLVWSRISRALAKVCFIICYIGLTSTGTIALACSSILIGGAVVGSD